MGVLKEIRIYKEKGMPPLYVQEAELVAQHGIKGDLHCMDESKQISIVRSELLAWMESLPVKGLCFERFCANLTIEGLDKEALNAGGVLQIGECSLQIMKNKKRCFTDECPLFNAGIPCALRYCFAKCIDSGELKVGDCVAASAK